LEEGCGETFPDSLGIKWVNELDRRAGEEGSKQGINDTMDMVKRENV